MGSREPHGRPRPFPHRSSGTPSHAGRWRVGTTVRTYRYDIGRRAVTMARARIDGHEVDQPIVDIGFELKPRESTARNGQLK